MGYIRSVTNKTNASSIDTPLSIKIIFEFDICTSDKKYAGIAEDVLIDKDGNPTFLIIEYNDSSCFKRYVAVPYPCINISLEKEIINLCWTKKKLEELPDFFFEES